MLETVKCVIVGDPGVGKRNLMRSFVKKKFDQTCGDRNSRSLNEYKCVVDHDGEEDVNLELWSTSGQEDLLKLRFLTYLNASLFIVTFSLIDSNSFRSVVSKWIPEIREFSEDNGCCCNIIVCGTKMDLRNSRAINDDVLGSQPVSTFCGLDLVEDGLDLLSYHECSSKMNVGVEFMFEEAVRVVIDQRRVTKRKSPHNCSIL